MRRVRVSDESGVVVEEETMIASSKKRPDQPALAMLTDWTPVDKTDHDADQSSDIDDSDIADTTAFDSTPSAEDQPEVEPVAEDAIEAGAKIAPRTNLLGDEPYGKLTAIGGQQATNEDVVVPSETSVAMCAAPSTTSSTADQDEVDRATIAPGRRSAKQGWVAQVAARGDEFSWLAHEEHHDERRASVESLVLEDEPITAETSTLVESAPPLPAVSEDVVAADVKASAKFDVDFDGLAQPKPAKVVRVTSKPAADVQSQPETEAAEEQIQTVRVSGRKLDDALARCSAIQFTDRSLPDGDDAASADEVEIDGVPESKLIEVTPATVQFAGPVVQEDSIVPEKKHSAVVVPVFPATETIEASPKTKKSGGFLGFFRHRSKNGDLTNSVAAPKIKSNSLDKRSTAEKPHPAEDNNRKSASTLPADAKKEKNGGRGRFHVGLNFGIGGGKEARGSATVEEQSRLPPKGQSNRTNATGETSSKSPSKTNIRVFEIMAGQQNGADAGAGEGGGPKEPLTPPTSPADQSSPSVTVGVPPSASVEPAKPSAPSLATTTSASLPEQVRAPPVVDVHVTTASPPAPTAPAFSSQYMVAVAIDFGSFRFHHIMSGKGKGPIRA